MQHYTSLWRMFFLLLLVGVTPVFIWAVMTQRIELRKRAATSEAVVCWNRVGGTAPTLYWPDGCKGNPSPQMCTQSTVPLTASEQYMYNQWVAGGKQYIPGCGMTPPSTTAINWRTPYAYLLASNMVITANGKVFKGVSNGPMSVHSNPASATYTTLESIWNENGVEMRMFIYFDASACTKSLPPQCNWRITELRIYNGNAQGDWIYFKGGDTISVGSRVGAEYTNPKLVLTSSENGIGTVEFSNLRLQAFTNQTVVNPPQTSCLNQKNGSPCSIDSCVTSTCSPNGLCVQKRTVGGACYITQGTCQNSQCIPTQRQLTCENLNVTQSSYFTMCAKEGYTGVCFNKYSGEYQGCNKGAYNDCTVNNTNATQNILCPAAVPPTPTCIPRPACMDPLPGQPACMMKLLAGAWYCPKSTPTPTCIPRPRCLVGNEFPDCKFAGAPAPLPPGGYYCPQTPTPTAICKQGVNTFSVGISCPTISGQFTTANFTCYDGFKGSVGDKSTCQTSLNLANLAQQACVGHSLCDVPTPACIPLPECVYNPKVVNGRPIICDIAPPPNGMKYCPRPTATPTPSSYNSKPGDFNSDGVVNIFDYNVLLSNFGKSGPIGFSIADLNRDGKIDLFDYNMILNYFGK